MASLRLRCFMLPGAGLVHPLQGLKVCRARLRHPLRGAEGRPQWQTSPTRLASIQIYDQCNQGKDTDGQSNKSGRVQGFCMRASSPRAAEAPS